jgi:UDP-N-acetylmuramoyl-tripeptide--D-alanyl-D-alanine ligase
MEASLKAFCMLAESLTKVVVLGDMLELGAETEHYHRKLGAFVAGLGIQTHCIGNYAPWIVEGAKAFDLSCEIYAYQKDAQEDLSIALSRIIHHGSALLLKGSRANRLEDLLECIENNQLSKE